MIADVSSSLAQKNIDLRPSPPSAGTVTLPMGPPPSPPPQKVPDVKIGPGVVVAPKAPSLGNPGNDITIAPSMIQPQMPPGNPEPASESIAEGAAVCANPNRDNTDQAVVVGSGTVLRARGTVS